MGQKLKNGQLDLPRETTSGKNGNFIRIGGIVICWGMDQVAFAGTTINLPYTYSTIPQAVIATTQDPNEQNAWTTGRTTSTIILKQKYTGGTLPVNWVVIGVA